MQTDEITAPELLEVEIRNYKNISHVRIPWSSGVALFGANGAGKTNILECLALLLGDRQTVNLTGRALRRADTAISVVMRLGRQWQPMSPDIAAVFSDKALTGANAHEAAESASINAQATLDGQWWKLVGADRGMDLAGGLASAHVPAAVVAYVEELAPDPVIRFTLDKFKLGGRDIAGDDLETVIRCYALTLMAPGPPEHLAGIADALPDVFAPLRASLASGDADWFGVLELPRSVEPPATLQWLPRARDADEINLHLGAAFRRAADSVEGLAEALAELPLSTRPADRDWHWWLHEVGAWRANEELALTMPTVTIASEGVHDATYFINSEVGDDSRELGETGTYEVLDYFSSGEGRWIDEALATIGRELSRFGDQAAWQLTLLGELDPDDLMHAVLSVADQIEGDPDNQDFWRGETLDLLLRALDEPLRRAGLRYLAEHAYPLGRQTVRLVLPGSRSLEPSLTIRVFDEPEAHLHPLAQRRLARALAEMRNAGTSIVIASHSAAFLDLPQWSFVHVRRGAAGTEASVLGPADMAARGTLAAQLGINRGDLLAGIGSVLVVEGRHDQLVLDATFGDELRAAGVAIIRMHGTANLLATADLDFVDRYLDVPITVLLDYVRADRARADEWETNEERALIELRRSCKRRGRRYRIEGLSRPDIVAYLSEAAIREEHPGFKGWAPIVEHYKGLRYRPSFKPWVAEEYGIDFRSVASIGEVLARMEEAGHQPAGELALVVSRIVAAALAGE